MNAKEKLIQIIIKHPELAEQIYQLIRSALNEMEGESND